jgi:glycosyltransferase 2 family protein
MNRALRHLVVAMLLGVALYGAVVLYAGYRDIEASLAEFRWIALLGALALATTNYLLRFLKWEYYLRLLDVRGIPKWESLLVFLSGFVLTVTPGKVGEVFKSAVLNRTHGVPLERTAPIIVAERLTDVIAVILLIALGSTGFSGGMHWAFAGALAVGLGLTVILWERPGIALVSWLEGRPRFTSLAPRVAASTDALRRIASPRALVGPIVLSMIGWGCEGVGLSVILWGFEAHSPLPLTVFFYSTASLAGALVPVPGGLGVVEAMLHEQLVRLGGVPVAQAAASMILIRFATLWWAVVVGFASLGLLRARYSGLHLGDTGPVVSTPDDSRQTSEDSVDRP